MEILLPGSLRSSQLTETQAGTVLHVDVPRPGLGVRMNLEQDRVGYFAVGANGPQWVEWAPNQYAGQRFPALGLPEFRLTLDSAPLQANRIDGVRDYSGFLQLQDGGPVVVAKRDRGARGHDILGVSLNDWTLVEPGHYDWFPLFSKWKIEARLAVCCDWFTVAEHEAPFTPRQ